MKKRVALFGSLGSISFSEKNNERFRTGRTDDNGAALGTGELVEGGLTSPAVEAVLEATMTFPHISYGTS